MAATEDLDQLLPSLARPDLGAGGGTLQASTVEGDNGTWALISGVVANNGSESPAEQTREVLARIETLAQAEGFACRHLARTWFFLDRILEWYDDFNQARAAFFRARGLAEGSFPASTGVGRPNLAGTAVAASALAFRPAGAGVEAERVPSPLQCSATDYSSSFSRAVCVTTPQTTRLLVSGTASLDQAGATLHRGDPVRQADHTLDVVESLLGARAMGWHDCSRAVLYVVAPDLAEEARARVEARTGLRPEVLQATLCRPDLLVELEVDAVTSEATRTP